MTDQSPGPDTGSAERDAQANAEATAIVRQSPDAAVDSAPVSDVEGLKDALLDEDAWSRDRWFHDDIEVHPALLVLRAAFPDAIVDAVRFRDETTIHVKREQWRTVCLLLKDEPRVRLNFLSDLTAVDMLRLRENPRFDVVAQLYSLPNRTRLRLKTGVDDGEPVPSLVPRGYRGPPRSHRAACRVLRRDRRCGPFSGRDHDSREARAVAHHLSLSEGRATSAA